MNIGVLPDSLTELTLDEALELARRVGATTVEFGAGTWITTSWPPETTQMLEHQWNDIALPYWADFAEFARAQGITKLAVEMHANQLVYNVPSALRLRDAIGDIVGVNFDPSHLFWMGADPLAAIAELGNAIQHVHAKDTRIETSVAVRSRLEGLTVHHPAERSWNYVTVGRGHDEAYWREFVAALAAVGYDGPLSIEHEDVAVGGADGVAEAAAVLRAALGS